MKHLLTIATDKKGKKNKEIWEKDLTMPKDAIFDGLVAALPGAEIRIDLGKKRPGDRIELQKGP
jgi:hypothetical protein